MGGTNSHYASESKQDKESILLPIPHEIYNPVRDWVADRKNTSLHAKGFVLFINNANKVFRTVIMGSRDADTFSKKVFKYFIEESHFKNYWGKLQKKYDVVYPSIALVEFVDGKTIKTQVKKPKRGTDAVADLLTYAVKYKNTCFIPVLILTENHANSGVIKYNPDYGLRCIFFDPHATKNSGGNVTTYLEGFFKSIELLQNVKLSVEFPWTEQGVQGPVPVCVQWSLIMLFTYLINCEYGECEDQYRMMTYALDVLASKRSTVITTWLYYMDLIVGKSDVTEDAWKYYPEANYAYEFEKQITREGEEVKINETTPLTPDFHPESEIDVYNCTSSPTCDEDECIKSDGKCVNRFLFVENRSRNPLQFYQNTPTPPPSSALVKFNPKTQTPPPSTAMVPTKPTQLLELNMNFNPQFLKKLLEENKPLQTQTAIVQVHPPDPKPQTATVQVTPAQTDIVPVTSDLPKPETAIVQVTHPKPETPTVAVTTSTPPDPPAVTKLPAPVKPPPRPTPATLKDFTRLFPDLYIFA